MSGNVEGGNEKGIPQDLVFGLTHKDKQEFARPNTAGKKKNSLCKEGIQGTKQGK